MTRSEVYANLGYLGGGGRAKSVKRVIASDLVIGKIKTYEPCANLGCVA
jgi:hypothetical protein